MHNNFVPDVSFDEQAFIEHGGVAYLDEQADGDPTRVVVGNAGGSTGGLEIRNGGVLNIVIGASSPGELTIGNTSGNSTSSVTILPGGTLTAEGGISLRAGDNNILRVGDTSGAAANLESLGNSSVTLRALTQVYPNANFTTGGNVSFSDSSTYQVEVMGASSNGSISAGVNANLNGMLNLNFNGHTPAAGESWSVMQANNIFGDFDSYTTNVPLATNETVVLSQSDLGGGRTSLNASIEEVLVLQVNRNTGAMTITHPGSTSIAFDGYFVGSDEGALVDNASEWTSLNESGQYGADWVETAQTANNIAELKVGADATFSGDIALGNLYDALAGDFGQSNENLSFGYRRASDGTEFPGVVEYVGDKINSLVLYVDPTGSGDAILRNASDTAVQIDGYEILSDEGSLSTAGWDSLDDQDDQANDWLEALDISSNLLAEFDSEGFTELAPGATFNLGPLFSGGAQDLDFNFLMMGQEDGMAGVVLYEAFATPGDYDQDGDVDMDDYDFWVAHFNESNGIGLQADGNLNGVVDAADFTVWRDNLQEMASSSNSTSIPEPAAALLSLMAIVAAGAARRRG
ncbi:hypothetical protein [Pseudobythopirellula maris]|uniref:hypothetical protein n=1 Tax=Pseudobythopirellula maris TaxID=2527991 RepID=UPI0018D42ABA|nr:hypothetical protein [Pseudobythopirellula maris]